MCLPILLLDQLGPIDLHDARDPRVLGQGVELPALEVHEEARPVLPVAPRLARPYHAPQGVQVLLLPSPAERAGPPDRRIGLLPVRNPEGYDVA